MASKLSLLSLIILVTILLTWAFWPVSTPKISNKHPAQATIAEMRWIEINGTQQWVLMRSVDRNNPILLVLHGGPGTSEAALFRAFNAPLETAFTVVHWDQRSTGKTLLNQGPDPSLDINTFIQDIDVLVDELRCEFNQSRIALLGHSWGSGIGIAYTHQHPEKVSGFIGVGQMSDMIANEDIGYGNALETARERNDGKALRELEAIGAPPHTWQEMLVQRKWASRFGGGVSSKHSKLSLAVKIVSQPEANARDLFAMVNGERVALSKLWPEIKNWDLTSSYVHFEVPVFFLLGRHDQFINPTLAKGYLAELSAPDKQVYWFERSAHSPPFEEPDRFNQLVSHELKQRLVLPEAFPSDSGACGS